MSGGKLKTASTDKYFKESCCKGEWTMGEVSGVGGGRVNVSFFLMDNITACLMLIGSSIDWRKGQIYAAGVITLDCAYIKLTSRYYIY